MGDVQASVIYTIFGQVGTSPPSGATGSQFIYNTYLRRLVSPSTMRMHALRANVKLAH